jgi:hypothetical protein
VWAFLTCLTSLLFNVLGDLALPNNAKPVVEENISHGTSFLSYKQNVMVSVAYVEYV